FDPRPQRDAIALAPLEREGVGGEAPIAPGPTADHEGSRAYGGAERAPDHVVGGERRRFRSHEVVPAPYRPQRRALREVAVGDQVGADTGGQRTLAHERSARGGEAG